MASTVEEEDPDLIIKINLTLLLVLTGLTKSPTRAVSQICFSADLLCRLFAGSFHLIASATVRSRGSPG